MRPWPTRSFNPGAFLLHGVTGSGKTEVYLRAIRRVVERGRQALFLVPEIALTSQTVRRVNARFPGRVAVLHSGLTEAQRFEQWWQIHDGAYDVVVGPRSALFAPLPRLGLIVIDEEHEWTYKQVELQPFYHARTAALELARLTGAAVILGSATPDVESYYQARQGRYRLLELPHRIGGGEPSPITPAPSDSLAPVEVCDMRRELRQGNRSIFSRSLARDLEDCIAGGRQAILFLNRRGSASFVQCRDCGHVLVCSSCALSLTWHAAEERLRCHHCNRAFRLPRSCRQCSGGRLRPLGIGTQRVVEEVQSRLPGVAVERWDADAFRRGTEPEEAMGRLLRGETQVLVGTQMVAKGLDLPNVALVGVVLADVGLHLPDFRAGERAFSLLCQVAGRAGRGGRTGGSSFRPTTRSITPWPPPPARLRRPVPHRVGDPPPAGQPSLQPADAPGLSGPEPGRLPAGGHRRRPAAAPGRPGKGLADVQVIGPAPGLPERVRGRSRWRVILRGRNLHRFLAAVPDLPTRNLSIDVDPLHLL